MVALALDEARKCTARAGAFNVGCVLVSRLPNSPPVELARGYSRELEGNTHAEANALEKARRLSQEDLRSLLSIDGGDPTLDEILRTTDVYTTMEPCSVRTSGLAPCCDALIAAKVARCMIGVGEPDDFVQCEGARKLTDAGIQVIWIKGMEEECLKVARQGCD